MLEDREGPWRPQLELHHAMLWGASWEEIVSAGQAGGYDAVVLRPYHLYEAREAGRSNGDIKAILADAGLIVHYLDGFPGGLPGSGSIEGKLKGGDVSEALVLEAMDAFGAKAINVPHYMGKVLPQPVLRDALAGLCERVGREGRAVLLEFQPESGVPDFLAAIALAEATGADNISVTVDTVQLAHAGGSPEQLTAENAHWLGAIQLADKRQPIRPGRIAEAERFSREFPGEGDLPLTEMLRRLGSLKPELPIGVEVFSEAVQAMPYSEAATRAADATRRLLDML